MAGLSCNSTNLEEYKNVVGYSIIILSYKPIGKGKNEKRSIRENKCIMNDVPL